MSKFRFLALLSCLCLIATAFMGCGGEKSTPPAQGGGELIPEPQEFVAKKLSNEADFQQVYYVSKFGSDENDGSYQKPFKTLERAREAVDLINDNMTADIAVVVREGTLYFEKSLTLSETDGGTNGHNIVYMSYPGEVVNLSGGVEITEWRRNEEGLYYARVDANMIREMYVDNVRATLAREPNGNAYHNILEWDEVNDKITVNTADLKGATENFETALYMEWAEPVLKTQSISRFSSKAVLNFADWEGYFLFNRGYHEYQKSNSLKCYFQNAKEFLDAPGEFYFEKSTSTLYYMPRQNEDMSNVCVHIPNIESIFKIAGSERGVLAENIVIQGFNMKDTGWYGFERYGYMEDQANHFGVAQMTADYMAYDVLPGAVHVYNAQNISVMDCTFSNLGNIGVNLYYGVANARITGNTFVDVGATAVMVAPHITGVIADQDLYNPSDKRVCVHDVEISNNYIGWVGVQYHRSCGITNVLGAKVTISDNEIAYGSNIGISNGWGWTLDERMIRENIITRNDVHHIGMNGSDLGGIYTLSYQPDTVISDNYVHEINRDYNGHGGDSPAYGLYIDEGSNRLSILNNQIAHAQEIIQSIYFHTLGTEFTVEGNKFLLCGDELDQEIIANSGVKTNDRLPYVHYGDYENAIEYMQAGIWTNANESGKYGYKIELEKDVIVYGLGRFYVTGNTGNHTLAIYDESGKRVAACAVNMKNAKTDAQGFVNAKFENPVKLKKGKSYFVVSEEVQFGDMYCDGLTKIFTASDSGINIVGISKGNSFSTVRNANSAFVGLNILIKK